MVLAAPIKNSLYYISQLKLTTWGSLLLHLTIIRYKHNRRQKIKKTKFEKRKEEDVPEGLILTKPVKSSNRLGSEVTIIKEVA